MFGLFKKKEKENPKFVCDYCGRTYEVTPRTSFKIKDGTLCYQCNYIITLYNRNAYALDKRNLSKEYEDVSLKDLPAMQAANERDTGRATEIISNSYSSRIKGLPISESVRMTTILDKDKLIFKSDDGQFRAQLPYSRILSVTFDSGAITNESRKENYPAMQAALGGILFGPTGAIVGAVSKGRKVTKWISGYTIDIFYTNAQGENAHIVLFETLELEYKPTGGWDVCKQYAQRIQERISKGNPKTITL